MIQNLAPCIAQTRMHVFICYPQPNSCYLRCSLHGHLKINIHILIIHGSCNRYLAALKTKCISKGKRNSQVNMETVVTSFAVVSSGFRSPFNQGQIITISLFDNIRANLVILQCLNVIEWGPILLLSQQISSFFKWFQGMNLIKHPWEYHLPK